MPIARFKPRLSNLDRDFNVMRCVCRACAHAKEIRLSELMHHYGGSYELDRLRARLVCMQCKGRDIEMRPAYDPALRRRR